MNIAKFLKTPFLQNTSERLVLNRLLVFANLVNAFRLRELIRYYFFEIVLREEKVVTIIISLFK